MKLWNLNILFWTTYSLFRIRMLCPLCSPISLAYLWFFVLQAAMQGTPLSEQEVCADETQKFLSMLQNWGIYHLFWKTILFSRWNVKLNGSTRWKFSGIEGMPPSFFHFNQNDRDKLYHLQKSHSCHSLTHGRRLCEPGTSRPSLPSSTGSFLTNGTASYFDPFLPEEINCSICPKKSLPKLPCKW